MAYLNICIMPGSNTYNKEAEPHEAEVKERNVKVTFLVSTGFSSGAVKI